LPVFPFSTEYAKLAVEADNRNEWEEAKNYYMQAVEYFTVHMKYDKNPNSKQAIHAKVWREHFFLLNTVSSPLLP